ncbi:MAG: hypothetical protein C6W58_04675 [Bacillaceae bacterium]|jgi:uncharacterized integral membrane protein (TIGR02327 family)|nr:MAG: hypothetical protein C6W58_04675 [Bacillaceae bacterium]REJ22820.1 MAG: hypothetical protein C6W54_12245 [Bacillaceae bacterium]
MNRKDFYIIKWVCETRKEDFGRRSNVAGLGQQALISIIVNLVFIFLTWRALQALQIEKIIRKGRVVETRLLLILLTIAIASSVSNFFLNYFFWSQQLQYLF